MTKRIGLGLFMCAFAGCGDNTTTMTDMLAAPDLTVTGNPDLTVVKDMVTVPDLVTVDAGPATVFNALLTGSQENPPVDTAANGAAVISIDAAKASIQVTLNVSGAMSITAAHIHAGKPGTNGPVIFPLAAMSFNGPLMKTLTAADFTAGGGLATFADAVAAIANGQTYVNVHTMANAGGEIRGHIGPFTFKSVLSATQEVPNNTSTAAGSVTIQLNGTQDGLAVTLNAGTLAGITAAHFHAGASGKNGPVIFPLATMAFASPLMKNLAAADFVAGGGLASFNDAIVAMLTGNVYANIHTMTNPGGEIRGQVGVVRLSSVLAGTQENPAVVTTASGNAVTTIDAEQTQITVRLTVASLANITAAHIHAGALGANGPVILPLASGTFMSPLVVTVKTGDLMVAAGAGINNFSDAVNALLSGRAYVNVHTQANAGGEIRGQVGPLTLKTTLAGTNEFPPVVTTATGSGVVSIDGLQSSMDVTLSYSGLMNITSAHIHVGAAGANGPVILPIAGMTFASPLKKTLIASDLTPQMAKGINTFADAVNAVLTQGTYLNIHTQANPGGEIRGQLAP